MKTTEALLFDPALLLEDEKVQLRIVSLGDLPQLKEIAFDAAIWTYFTTEIITAQELKTYVNDALVDYSNKQKVPFVIVDKSKKRIVGMSSFGNISIADARIEIGWSWLSTASQGTGINQICKSLMAAFVFDQLNFARLEFKTDVLNVRARRALIKIGATEEGVLRSHTLMPHNRRRDTIYYSILQQEWESVKKAH